MKTLKNVLAVSYNNGTCIDSDFSISNVAKTKFKTLVTIDKNIEFLEGDPSLAELVLEYDSGSGYIVRSNDKGSDCLESAYGVNSNFSIVVTKRFVGLFYGTTGVNKLYVYDGATSNISFEQLFPTTYAASSFSTLVGVFPSRAVVVGNGYLRYTILFRFLLTVEAW